MVQAQEERRAVARDGGSTTSHAREVPWSRFPVRPHILCHACGREPARDRDDTRVVTRRRLAQGPTAGATPVRERAGAALLDDEAR